MNDANTRAIADGIWLCRDIVRENTGCELIDRAWQASPLLEGGWVGYLLLRKGGFPFEVAIHWSDARLMSLRDSAEELVGAVYAAIDSRLAELVGVL